MCNWTEEYLDGYRKRLDVKKEVRAIARERVGTVPSSKVIRSKKDRKPKHKKLDLDLG